MIMMINIILIIAVVITINSPFQPGDFFTGSTTVYKHENYNIKNICVYSKSLIKTKVTSKQNLLSIYLSQNKSMQKNTYMFT